MGPPPMMMGGPPGANNYFNLPPPMMGMIAPPGTHPPTLPTPPLAACSASLAGEHGWLEQRAWLVVQHPNPYLDTLRSLGRGPCTSRRDAAARHDAADGARRVAHLLPVDEPKHDGKLSGAAAAGRPWPWRRAAAVRSSVPRRVCVCVCVRLLLFYDTSPNVFAILSWHMFCWSRVLGEPRAGIVWRWRADAGAGLLL